MSNFIMKDNQIINLANVSTIKMHKEKNRIIFNLNYSINIDRLGSEKIRADYVYWDFDGAEILEDVFEKISKNEFVQENFLTIKNNNPVFLVNKNSVSSIKFEQNYSRLIFNLNNLRDFLNSKSGIKSTSDFFFVDFDDPEKALTEYQNLVKVLVK